MFEKKWVPIGDQKPPQKQLLESMRKKRGHGCLPTGAHEQVARVPRLMHRIPRGINMDQYEGTFHRGGGGRAGRVTARPPKTKIPFSVHIDPY